MKTMSIYEDTEDVGTALGIGTLDLHKGLRMIHSTGIDFLSRLILRVV